ncbi:solute carrier organic anion transporter family member 4A1 [Caerostris extrusa]|uniref:Solute carrier organic anion transporter family member 4A1 n=1 Tax=Caerostris extrusa TaxID=172846 RepID=A0AAV4WW23_CAEEX|nr:solute carrier organic anion transporter family member 4A1 [Caerostris extrusa]
MKTENNHKTIRTSSSISDAYDMHESHSHEPLVAQTYNLENFSNAVEDKLEDDEDEDDMGSPCGWGGLQPSNLQRFRSARWVLFWLCWAGFLQGLIVNGFINVVITTIEKRYQLRSTESGLIAGGYDIASFLCLIPVSYLGGSRSKPVFIGSGVLVLAPWLFCVLSTSLHVRTLLLQPGARGRLFLRGQFSGLLWRRCVTPLQIQVSVFSGTAAPRCWSCSVLHARVYLPG